LIRQGSAQLPFDIGDAFVEVHGILRDVAGETIIHFPTIIGDSLTCWESG
jgi:hypothetical protein